MEHTAYAPLLRACAEQGILCVLVKMPCNLAVLNVNGADGIRERFPGIDRWYIGGHSLGRAVAAVALGSAATGRRIATAHLEYRIKNKSSRRWMKSFG